MAGSELQKLYTERNKVIALAARLAVDNGYKAGIGKDKSETDPKWQNVVYIELPNVGQVSWHVPLEELHLFSFLGVYTEPFDGHTTEQKYKRIESFL